MTETPTSTWEGVRLTGTYESPIKGGPMLAGSYAITLTHPVVNITEKKRFPAGVFASGELNTVEGSPSMDLIVPVTDDPDNRTMTKLRVDISLRGYQAESFLLDIPIAMVGHTLDLSEFVSTQGLPKTAANQVIVGVAGGLVPLDSSGKIPIGYLPTSEGTLPTPDAGDVLQGTQDGNWVARALTVGVANVEGLQDVLDDKANITEVVTLSRIEPIEQELDRKASAQSVTDLADNVPSRGQTITNIVLSGNALYQYRADNSAPEKIGDLAISTGGGSTPALSPSQVYAL